MKDPEDEFEKRARLAAEAQEIERAYRNNFRHTAQTALLLGIGGIAIMFIAYTVSVMNFGPTSQLPPQPPQVHPATRH